MSLHDAGVGPHAGEALVDLDSGVVVGLAETKGVATPDEETPLTLLRGEKLIHHLAHVVGAGRGPDGHVEGLDAVRHECLRVRALDEVKGTALVGTVEEGAVEVHDDEDTTRLV